MREETINKILKFRDDRDWKQFHNPKDLKNRALKTKKPNRNCNFQCKYQVRRAQKAQCGAKAPLFFRQQNTEYHTFEKHCV